MMLYTEDAAILQPIIVLSVRAYRCQGGVESALSIKLRGVELMGIVGGEQRRYAPLLVTGVARRHFIAHRRSIDRLAARRQLRASSGHTLLQAGGDEQLMGSPGEDDAADVAAVDHRAGRIGGVCPLIGQQDLANCRDGGQDRCRLTDRLLTQAGGVEIVFGQGLRRGHGFFRIVGRIAGAQKLGGDRAIEPAAIEITQSEVSGEAARQCTLAGRRRTIDSNDRDVRQSSRPGC